MRKKLAFFVAFSFLTAFQSATLFAAETGDEGEGNALYLESLLRREKVLEEKIPIEIELREKVKQVRPKPALPEEKVFIKEIIVAGITVLSPREIKDIIGPFYNRELSGKQMQRCADQISDWYSLNGYLTSYTYIDPGKLGEGILMIQCVEGKVKEVQITGNQYFSTDIYKQRAGLKPGDPFNLKLLKNNLYRTNRHMDRKVTYEIKPSEGLESVDIVLKAKDKLPLHASFSVDNYGSEYILRKRYRNTFIHNNLTGHDDQLFLKAQFAEADAQQLYDFDYFLPLNNNWKFELYYMPFKKENYYYSDNRETDFEKKAYKWYCYFYQTIFAEPNREFIMNYGFVQKDIFWYTYGQKQKQDRFRALLWGFDYVRSDDFGTTVVSNDLEIGIPRMWGGAAALDDSCSVKGAGGKYKKDKLYVARRQKLPWGIDLLLKGQGQLSSQALTGVNVFSIGGFMGVIDNRGYPRASQPADSGYYFMGGFSFPPYLIPRDIRIPFSKAKWHDSLKLFTFAEYAKGYKTAPKTAAEKAGGVVQSESGPSDDNKRKSLASAGCGLTFSLPEHGLSMRLDVGWPLDHKVGKDGDHAHTWFGVSKNF